jgi:hypothetical protein
VGGKSEKNEIGGAGGACGGGERCAQGKRPLGKPDIDGRIVLVWIFRELEGVVGTGWSLLMIETGGGHL